MSLKKLGEVTGSAIPSSADVILVAGAGGAFGGVLVASGIGNALAEALETIHLPLMPAAFLLSLVLRASQGSATVAILTTSGLLSQAVVGLEPLQLVLVTLATCFGSLGLSHVNDAGFWVVTRYLGLSVPDGLKTWTVLTTIMGVTGFLITAAVVCALMLTWVAPATLTSPGTGPDPLPLSDRRPAADSVTGIK